MPQSSGTQETLTSDSKVWKGLGLCGRVLVLQREDSRLSENETISLSLKGNWVCSDMVSTDSLVIGAQG